ncbi:class I SAM-dependent methyltransferase [Nocardia terpenica]|uniref:Methyltransferase domain-containing protein n=1 Tax=Nocardia terpenica TaxID=455432 RepID=A0A6G9ZAB5_9NOCA|nr:methyltransferase domain-containing protein [Nocardia terpenica]QIS22106.1 methyltransferase domain-containing protein [Nocardia terpenica]
MVQSNHAPKVEAHALTRQVGQPGARPGLAGADLRVGRAQDLSFSDNAFDAVVSHMAIMLMGDVERVVTQVARVLRIGGTLVIAVGAHPAPDSGYELFLSLARPFFAQIPPPRRMPALGDRRTRARTGLDDLLAPPVSSR